MTTTYLLDIAPFLQGGKILSEQFDHPGSGSAGQILAPETPALRTFYRAWCVPNGRHSIRNAIHVGSAGHIACGAVSCAFIEI